MAFLRRWLRARYWWWILAKPGGLRGLRSKLKQLNAKAPNHAAWDSEFSWLMDEADVLFRAGDYRQAVTLFHAAALRQATCRDANGLGDLGLRLAGSELLNPIGHMAIALTLRAKLTALNLHLHPPVLLLTGTEANPAYGEYWSNFFPTVRVARRAREELEASFWPVFERIGWIARSEGTTQTLYQAIAESEEIWSRQRRPGILSVSQEHISKGSELLTSLGLEPNDWFVAIHLRQGPEGPDYGRNVDFGNYARAVNLIKSMGGHVIVVGARNLRKPPLSGVIMPKRGSLDQSWIDLFLLGRARMVIGTQSGPSSVAASFGTPTLMTNAVGWGFLPYFSNVMVLPKNVTEKSSQAKPLSLTSMIDRGLSTFSGVFDKEGLGHYRWLDNSALEIESAVKELLDGNPFDRPVSFQERKIDEMHVALSGYRGPKLSSIYLHRQSF